jgi:hypothetical protein
VIPIARLAVRNARFEIIAIGLSVTAAISVIGALSFALSVMEVPVPCLADPGVQSCESTRAGEWIELATQTGDPIMVALVVLAIGAGALMGLQVVAAEIESGTAVTAWWLARSRPRWLLQRVLILGMILLFMLILLSLASEYFEGVRRPLTDTLRSFQNFHARGLVVIGYGLLAFAVATLTGTILGRAIPSLIVTVAVSVLALGAAVLLFPFWRPQVALEKQGGEVQDPAAVILDSLYQDTDGVIMTWDEVRTESPYAEGTREFAFWVAENVVTLPRGYPGGFYLSVQLRELVALIVTSIVIIATSAFIVRHRRPI